MCYYYYCGRIGVWCGSAAKILWYEGGSGYGWMKNEKAAAVLLDA